jgi:NADP-dependent 3-hydroxy acid dehydrogenase YdfG
VRFRGRKISPATIVITGATGVIDSYPATLLSARGEMLLPCGRGDEKLETLNRALGGAHHAVVADLTDTAGCALSQAKAMRLGSSVATPIAIASARPSRSSCPERSRPD